MKFVLHVPLALHVQLLGGCDMAPGCLGLILSWVLFLSLLPCPLLPPATTRLRLPPSLAWTLRHIPPALTLWCPAASGFMGALEPCSRLLLLPLLLAVGGELGASAPASRVPGLSLGQGRAGSGVKRENEKWVLGWEQVPSLPKPGGFSQSWSSQVSSSTTSSGEETSKGVATGHIVQK